MITLHVIGGGLAGSEAAWQAARLGIKVVIHEMRPSRMTDAHTSDSLAELVCSNSFRSDDWEYNAVGLLHKEMRRSNSLIMEVADYNKLPAGGALAVDRDGFSAQVTQQLRDHPNIDIERGEISDLPPEDWQSVIIATGPLTSESLTDKIRGLTGEQALAFFDAIAPIVYKDSINFDKVWYQSRYDKSGPDGSGKDYINCPLDKDQYYEFVDALLEGDKTDFHDWEKSTPYFSGCLPIEVMAERGRETLRFGPMKPVGLTNKHKPDEKPYAVVQLRQDNALGTLWNIVGFQTKLKYGVQSEIFRNIPGLEEAVFARLGGLHRNTFLNSPQVLDSTLRLKNDSRLRFAGQITGVEGYVESAAIGLYCGQVAASEIKGNPISNPPPTTAIGALLNHITGGHLSVANSSQTSSFQPMNINYGLFPPIEVENSVNGQRLRGKEKSRARKRAMSVRALENHEVWLRGFSQSAE